LRRPLRNSGERFGVFGATTSSSGLGVSVSAAGASKSIGSWAGDFAVAGRGCRSIPKRSRSSRAKALNSSSVCVADSELTGRVFPSLSMVPVHSKPFSSRKSAISLSLKAPPAPARRRVRLPERL